MFFVRLTPDKGIFKLLRAWMIVEDALPNVRLKTMGTFVTEWLGLSSIY